MSGITQWDLSVLDFIREHFRCGFLDAVMPMVTRLGDSGIFWIILAAALLISPKTRRYGFTVAVALVIGALVCNVTLKPLVARIRPYELTGMIQQLLIAPPSDFSFPSGHTTASFAAAVSLMASKAKGWPAALLLAVLIAFSRLYLYVHYPTDVLAGAVIGAAAGLIAYAVVWKKLRRGDSVL